MQDNTGADNSASARKALARAQRVLQVTASKRHALALHDVRETLEECLRPEASAAMKALGYRLATKAPTSMTSDTWAAVLDACVAELAGSQNASVLPLSLSALEQAPPPLLLGLFVSTEKEPMNKLRAALTHESADARACAVSTLSRVALGVASSVTSGGLSAFPFESHEARVCCQQDVWSMAVDVWKLVFQTLLLDDPRQRDAVGAAFAAMKMLFAKTAVMAPFFPLARVHPRSQATMNDMAAAMFKEAFPRARALTAAARVLPMKHQATAALWIAMLLFMMMERTGARCPSVSGPYLELDIDAAESDDADPDADDSASTERVRIDELVRELLRSWMVPLLSKKASLSQGTSVCRAVFILLSHPLQQLTRVEYSSVLISHVSAQCWFVKSGAVKLEFAQMLVAVFAWLSGAGCLAWFARVVHAVFLVDREADRSELLQSLLASVLDRVHRHRDFELFEALCAVEHTSPPQSKLLQSTVVAEVFQSVARAVTSGDEAAHVDAKRGVLLTQLVVLKEFKGALTPKLPSGSEDPAEADNRRAMLRCYMALLTAHFLQATAWSTGAFRESLEFFRKEILKVWRQIPSLRARLQLLSIGMHLVHEYQLVAAQVMIDAVKFEVAVTFARASEQDGDVASSALPSAAATAAFDTGRLGSGSTMCGAIVDLVYDGSQQRWVGTDALLAVAECLKRMVGLWPSAMAQLDEMYQDLQLYVAKSCPATQLCRHILDPQRLREAPASPLIFFSQEPMNPYTNFAPLHRRALPSPRSDEDKRGKEAVLVTGSADPLAIQLSYYQPSYLALDVVVLEITCCNLTSLALSDFELRVCPVGSAARCVDASNDLKVRVLPAGGAVSSTLLPFGVVKAEKRFQICKFTQASFRMQVSFSDAGASSSEQQDQEQTREVAPMRLAMSEAFVVPFNAFLSAPSGADATASFFQTLWQSAQSAIQLPVQSRACDASEAANALSVCQKVLQRQNPRISVVPELLVDLPFYCHVSLIAKTRWDDYITASLMLIQTGENAPMQAGGAAPTRTPGQQWSGVLELRSTATNTGELDKNALDAIQIFTGGVLEQAFVQGATGTPTPLSLGTVMATADPAADPFATPKADAAPTFPAAFQPVETRLPQGASLDASNWMDMSGAGPKATALPLGVTATPASLDPWL